MVVLRVLINSSLEDSSGMGRNGVPVSQQTAMSNIVTSSREQMTPNGEFSSNSKLLLSFHSRNRSAKSNKSERKTIC